MMSGLATVAVGHTFDTVKVLTFQSQFRSFFPSHPVYIDIYRKGVFQVCIDRYVTLVCYRLCPTELVKVKLPRCNMF